MTFTIVKNDKIKKYIFKNKLTIFSAWNKIG